MRLGVEGDVTLSIRIGADGRVDAAEVIHGNAEGLGEAALEAASRLRFRPARAAGRPVAVRARWVCRFRLP